MCSVMRKFSSSKVLIIIRIKSKFVAKFMMYVPILY